MTRRRALRYAALLPLLGLLAACKKKGEPTTTTGGGNPDSGY